MPTARLWMKNRAVKGSGRSIPFIFICIFGGAAIEIAAQEPLASGSRVRVTAPDCALRGEAATFRGLAALAWTDQSGSTDLKRGFVDGI